MRVNENSARLPEIRRGDKILVQVNGKNVTAHQGETIAAVLLAAGIRVFHHAEDGTPRGVYCGIGRCFSCLVTVDGQSGVRACVTQARPGMQVETAIEGEA